MKLINTLLVLTVSLCSLPASAQTQTTEPGSDQHVADMHDEHDEHNASTNVDHDDHDDREEGGYKAQEQAAGVVELTKVSRAMAGIEVTKLTKIQLPEVINAPGEVQLDQYRSAEVTPLVDAVVVKRHARLGDAVVVGQPLVTLASVAVAGAQGDLRVSAAEWQRVRKPGHCRCQTLYGRRGGLPAGAAQAQRLWS